MASNGIKKHAPWLSVLGNLNPGPCYMFTGTDESIPLFGVAQLNQLIQFLPGCARIDGFRRHANALTHGVYRATYIKGGATVKQNHVAPGSLFTTKDAL